MSNWDIEELGVCPKYDTIASENGIESILYENEPYSGKPARVFAYMGFPRSGANKLPAMICVHGAEGTAFKEWVKLWNARGYAAIAMDLGGCGIDKQRLPDGGPDQKYENKFNLDVGWKNLWTYHAVAAVMRANSILRSHPRVDPQRIGVAGISWGGYLACIVAGVDARLACAISVYGCGFLQDNGHARRSEAFAAMTPQRRKEWHELCDPSVYLPQCQAPMMFITGTNDFAYPLDILKKSYSLLKSPYTLSVRLEMPHSHEQGWGAKEPFVFADSVLRGKAPMPKIGSLLEDEDTVRARFESELPIRRGYLLYTEDEGAWQERKWRKVPASVVRDTVLAILPETAIAYFLAIENESGTYVSSQHEELEY